jgi:alkylated DNA repair dioxygenase AlkB
MTNMSKDENNTITYEDAKFNISVRPIFTHDESIEMCKYFLENAKFKLNRGVSKRRNKVIYGEIPHYKAVYQGKEFVSKVIPWDELPHLVMLRDYITNITGQNYNICVIQHYNNGDVGINPHRDKEMKSGTIIASVSFGETRIMKFDSMRHPKKSYEIPLPSGSLCLINPPTNDCWLHSIPKDDTQHSRISVIFRLYIE